MFVLLPRIVFGSAYADMRLAPYLFAIAIVAIRFKDSAGPMFQRAIAIAGLAFILVRTGGTGVSMWLYDRRYDRELAALDSCPARRPDGELRRPALRRALGDARLLHLPGMAIVRNHAFSNDQWTMAGAQLLHVRYRPGWPFIRDATQIVTERRCPREYWRSRSTWRWRSCRATRSTMSG